METGFLSVLSCCCDTPVAGDIFPIFHGLSVQRPCLRRFVSSKGIQNLKLVKSGQVLRRGRCNIARKTFKHCM